MVIGYQRMCLLCVRVVGKCWKVLETYEALDVDVFFFNIFMHVPFFQFFVLFSLVLRKRGGICFTGICTPTLSLFTCVFLLRFFSPLFWSVLVITITFPQSVLWKCVICLYCAGVKEILRLHSVLDITKIHERSTNHSTFDRGVSLEVCCGQT